MKTKPQQKWSLWHWNETENVRNENNELSGISVLTCPPCRGVNLDVVVLQHCRTLRSSKDVNFLSIRKHSWAKGHAYISVLLLILLCQLQFSVCVAAWKAICSQVEPVPSVRCWWGRCNARLKLHSLAARTCIIDTRCALTGLYYYLNLMIVKWNDAISLSSRSYSSQD